ncbi:hypothetical protein F5Y00DRAFT_229857 [Daldinia vernicosa]|uniref:uncharacterized protein n=1 Tax=Daldinia vernicosa TaxID=114800 RepID=UPI0020076633|nr:uncharacterized protein F5Y00DRAFT_229857 [Daldinia vernicosa]KAI0851493.1 hypothetical protein F5Y00DRAFT_229857 [Daldinia vernicosa]
MIYHHHSPFLLFIILFFFDSEYIIDSTIRFVCLFAPQPAKPVYVNQPHLTASCSTDGYVMHARTSRHGEGSASNSTHLLAHVYIYVGMYVYVYVYVGMCRF